MAVKLGIIGTGLMAHSHAKNFSLLGNVKVTACADIVAERAEAFAREFAIPEVYSSAEELINQGDVTAVVVATPDIEHASNTLAALKKGLHVLCEKPLATTVADARKMHNLANRKGLVNMVNFTYRDCPAVAHVARLIAEGKIGRLTNIIASYKQSWLTTNIWGDWRKTHAWLWRQDVSRGSAGVLGDIGVHLFDAISLLAGPPARLFAHLHTYSHIKGKSHGGYTLDANDSVTGLIDFPGGAQGVFLCSRFTTGEANTIEITLHGEHGAYRINLRKSVDEFYACVGDDAAKAEWRAERAPDYAGIRERFVAAITGAKLTGPTFEDGLTAQCLIESSFRSALESNWVKLEY